jgi:endonuclease G
MLKPADISERKLKVMAEASQRWKEKAPAVARTTELLRKGGPKAASAPERVARFEAREYMKSVVRPFGIGFERKIGPTLDLDDTPTPTERKAGASVARIVELKQDGRIGEGFATGFLVTPNLLMTNWHVFERSSDATGCGAQLGYERNDAGMIENGLVFELDPDRFFISNETLDIALVGIKTLPIAGTAPAFPPETVRLIPTAGKILAGLAINIIQHPDGQHKHWAVSENKLMLDPLDQDLFLTYSADTLEGSSGSPAFNTDWELVAIHHSAVPRMEGNDILTVNNTVWRKGMPETDIDWVANEGVRVSKVHQYLSSLQLSSANAQEELSRLLANSTDPFTNNESLVRIQPPASFIPNSTATMNIVVHGTANFYTSPIPPPHQLTAPPPAASALVRPGQEKKLRFDPDYKGRPGYQDDFLEGFPIPTPVADTSQVLKEGNKTLVLKYHHYSLVLHRKRRLAIWTAANADYTPSKRTKSRDDFGSDTWKPDPRIPIERQIEDVEFYEPAKKFDRGHLVRRDDVAWGETLIEEEYGNSDSFHWTNCTPQHEEFNRDMFQYNGLWGQLENHITKQSKAVGNRLTIFAGPFLSDDDEERDFGAGIKVKVPVSFWKIVVAVEENAGLRTLRAYGFVLDQTDAIKEFGWEGRFRVGKFSEQQYSLADIAGWANITFAQVLLDADPMAVEPLESRKRRLASLDSVKLR